VAWSFVSAAVTAADSTATVTKSVTAGNLLYVYAESGVAGDTLTIGDTDGNTWLKCGTDISDAGHNNELARWVAKAKTTTSITVTISGASAMEGLALAEYASSVGVPADPRDVSNQTSNSVSAGTGTDGVVAPAATPTAAGELQICVVANTVGANIDTVPDFNAGTGFTRRATASRDVTAGQNVTELEDKLSAGSGSQTATWTGVVAVDFIAVNDFFKESGGGAFTLTAEPGNYALVGSAVNLRVPDKLWLRHRTAAAAAPAGGPGLLWQIVSPVGNVSGMTTTMTLQCVHPTQVGNTLVLCVMNNDYGMLLTSVTDDKGNAWTRHDYLSAGSLAGYSVWSTTGGVAAGTRALTLTFSTTDGYIQYALSEWCNVDPTTPIQNLTHVDGTSGSTTWAAGSITPPAGDMVYHFASANAGGAYTAASRATPGSGFTLHGADASNGFYTQTRLADGSAINPTITVPSSHTYLSVAFSLKASATAQGSPGPAFHVKHVQGSNWHAAHDALAYFYQFPTEGSLQIVLGSIVDMTITSITSSGSNFSHVTGSPTSNGGNIVHLQNQNQTPSAINSGTVTGSAAPGGAGPCFWFLDVVGAAAAAYDKSEATTGTMSSGTSLTTHTAYAPTGGAASLFVDYIDHDAGSEIGLSGDADMTMPIPYLGQNGGDSVVAWTADSGMLLKLTPAAVTSTYTRSATPAGPWGAIAAFYKAA
jgi:hypothetical protein